MNRAWVSCRGPELFIALSPGGSYSVLSEILVNQISDLIYQITIGQEGGIAKISSMSIEFQSLEAFDIVLNLFLMIYLPL